MILENRAYKFYLYRNANEYKVKSLIINQIAVDLFQGVINDNEKSFEVLKEYNCNTLTNLDEYKRIANKILKEIQDERKEYQK